MAAAPATPLKYLAPAWFATVMGLSGLALAWHQAQALMGDLAGAASWALGGVAAVLATVLAVASALRWHRYPSAWAEDLRHPVRHAFVATLPVSLILLATVAVAMTGPSGPARLAWIAGALWQLAVTVWVVGRWWRPTSTPGPAWTAFTPVMLIPVVGNVLLPLAGVPLGLTAWSVAQMAVGLFLWPLLLGLLFVRVGVQGPWPDRLLPTAFITVAPPSVVGLAVLQLGASTLWAWGLWGLALFFVLLSAGVLRRALAQPFSMSFWALSFPLAAFSALGLRLAPSAPAGFAAFAMVCLALTSFVVAALVLATWKGLRDGSLLAPEPVAALIPASGGNAP